MGFAVPGTGSWAAAFAPGHVTGVFRPVLAPADPLARGSIGAGVVLDLGARARAFARPAPPGQGRIELLEAGRPAHLPITERALSLLPKVRDHYLHVELTHELPVAQGLSMSAAGALSSSLAAASALGVPLTEAHAAAHLADLGLHGGLGGVSAILDGGGIEVRRVAGLPPVGRIERTHLQQGFFLGTTGAPLPSPPLLSDPAFLQRVREAADTCVGALGPPPLTWEATLDVFERFTDALALAPPALRRVLDDLRAQGCRVAQAMLGHTLVVSAGDEEAEARCLSTLRKAHLTPWRVHVGARGAGLVHLHPP